MVSSGLSLITLEDGHASYKGTWSLILNPGKKLAAIHTTFQHAQGPGCVIETLDFQAKETAVEFLRHLMLHNWQLCDVKNEAEPILLGLAT
ncbi:MAG: hypothetical protein VKI39_01830 [Synechococcus sp.]|nr:hypothetical protein [Synechococcus sp.]